MYLLFLLFLGFFSLLPAQEKSGFRIWAGLGVGVTRAPSLTEDVGASGEWSVGAGNSQFQVKYAQTYLFQNIFPISTPVTHIRTQALLLGGRLPLNPLLYFTAHVGGGPSANITAGVENDVFFAQKRVILSDLRSNCMMVQVGLDRRLDDYSALEFHITYIRNSHGSYSNFLGSLQLGIL